MKEEQFKKFNRIKYTKFILAVIIDLLGNATYFIPALGESVDVFWGPISTVFIFLLFPNHWIMAISGGVEESLPMTDIIPTALVVWSLDYVKDEEKTLAKFEKKEAKRNRL